MTDRSSNTPYLRPLAAEAAFFGLTAVTATGAILLSPFDRHGKPLDAVHRAWAQSLFPLAGVDIDGPPMPPDSKQPYVVMCNHESHLDPPLLLARYHGHLRFVAKIELLRIPFLGPAIKYCGHITIDRRDHERAIASLQRAGRQIREGTSILIFPEGTRNPHPDGTLQPFKKGGFMLAIEAQVPILPIGLAGTGNLLPRGALRIRPGKIAYALGEPIPTAGCTPKDRDVLMARVRDTMAKARAAAAARL